MLFYDIYILHCCHQIKEGNLPPRWGMKQWTSVCEANVLRLTLQQATGIHVSVDNYTFKVMNNIVYFGASVSTTNNASLAIQRRLTFANRYSCGLNRQLSSKVRRRRTKLTLYKTLFIPDLKYGAESWTMSAAVDI